MADDSVRLSREHHGTYLVRDAITDVVLGRVHRRGNNDWSAWIQIHKFEQATEKMIYGGRHFSRRDAVAEVLILRDDLRWRQRS